MPNLIRRNFTVGVQVANNGGGAGFVIHCRKIGGRGSLAFGGSEKDSVREALDKAVVQAIEHYQSVEEANILDCLVAHWWEYTNVLYSYSPSEGGRNSDWALGLLEFYVQQFTLGMVLFLIGLSDSDVAVIETALLSEISYDNSDYSELVAIREFYLRYKDYLGSNM